MQNINWFNNKILFKTYLIIGLLVCMCSASFASKLPNVNLPFAATSPTQELKVMSNSQFHDKNEVDSFLDKITKKYFEDMKNADPEEGEILWGGEIEIRALADLFRCRIEIYKEGAIDKTSIKYGEEDGVVIKLVHCSGDHYKFIKPSAKNEMVDVKPDGNCLFYAYLGATDQEQSIEEVKMLRETVMDYIGDNEDLCADVRMMFEVVTSAQDIKSLLNTLAAIPEGALKDEVGDFAISRLPGGVLYGNGDRYMGQWLHGKRHGQGTMFYKNGDRYEGEWQNAKCHGHGKLFHNNGELEEGEWFNGECVKNTMSYGFM